MEIDDSAVGWLAKHLQQGKCIGAEVSGGVLQLDFESGRFVVQSAWRLLARGYIVAASHSDQWIQDRMNRRLRGYSVEHLAIQSQFNDLDVYFEDGLLLQTFADSQGHQHWSFSGGPREMLVAGPGTLWSLFQPTELLRANAYFSYHQILVFDPTNEYPALAWTEAESQQGFARRSTCASFGTLVQFGEASLSLVLGDLPALDGYIRVISVPIHIPSGQMCVEGIEDVGTSRPIRIEPGHYRLTCAHRIVVPAGDMDEEHKIAIDLFLSPTPVPETVSVLLVADSDLSPGESLIEETPVANWQAAVTLPDQGG